MKSKSNGHETQIINFYNPSSSPQTIDPTLYYLNSTRSDIQRIALAPTMAMSTYYTNHLEQFFKWFLGQTGSLYPTLNDKERRLVRQYPYESIKVFWYVLKSEAAMEIFFHKESHIDGEGDAFRHFVWAGFLTHELGENLAKRFLNAHESNEQVYLPNHLMDQHNNAKGIEAALKLDKKNRFSDQALYREAIKALRNEELSVLKSTGNIPHDSSY